MLQLTWGNLHKHQAELHKADYLDKDQSYVLHMLDSKKLAQIEFPLGTISKPEVRQIAASLDLKTAFKKDSQDIFKSLVAVICESF